MKKVSFIAAFAFAAFFSNSANATTFRTENAETITTRTETPVNILGAEMLKITITIHFKRWDLTIEIECITAGGGGGNNGGTTEVDGTIEGNMLKIQMPEAQNRNLVGASQFRVVKGGTFKLANGEVITIKDGQMLKTTDMKTLTCPVVKKQTQGATFGEKVNAGKN
jgi:hypothetical protein